MLSKMDAYQPQTVVVSQVRIGTGAMKFVAGPFVLASTLMLSGGCASAGTSVDTPYITLAVAGRYKFAGAALPHAVTHSES